MYNYKLMQVSKRLSSITVTLFPKSVVYYNYFNESFNPVGEVRKTKSRIMAARSSFFVSCPRARGQSNQHYLLRTMGSGQYRK